MYKRQLLTQQSCCKRAFIRGAFLASGSISDPEKGYHFEIVTQDERKAAHLQEIICSFQIDAKIVLRKKSYVVYVKEGAQIVDMLAIMEANVALMNQMCIRDRYCVEYKTEDTEWSHIDDPGNNCGNSISNIFKYILGHVIGSTECKAKKNCPHKDADIVCVHKGRYRVGNQIQKEIVENLDNTLRCCCICSGSSGKCQFYRKCHTCKYGNDCGKYSTENVKYDNCLDDTEMCIRDRACDVR